MILCKLKKYKDARGVSLYPLKSPFRIDDTHKSVYNKWQKGEPMKRRDFIKKLENGGFVFHRHGANHDVYIRGTEREEVPRHAEINELLAKKVIKRRGL